MNDPTHTRNNLVVVAVDAVKTRVIIFFFTFSLYVFCYFDVYDDRSNGNLYISSAACRAHNNSSCLTDCVHQQNPTVDHKDVDYLSLQ